MVSVVMALLGRRRYSAARIPLQEAPGLFLFLELRWCLRIERFHSLNLVRCQLRQTPNEMHQPPAFALAFGRSVSPGRHSGQANPVLDDREQLTVSQ